MNVVVSPASLYTSCMSDADKIVESALRLPVGERARLASRLIESLDEAGQEPDVEAAWQKEIARRIRDLLEGRARTVPADQALREIRKKLTERP